MYEQEFGRRFRLACSHLALESGRTLATAKDILRRHELHIEGAEPKDEVAGLLIYAVQTGLTPSLIRDAYNRAFPMGAALSRALAAQGDPR